MGRVTPAEALAALARLSANGSGAHDKRERAEQVLQLALQASHAQGAFLARVEGTGLHLTLARQSTGESWEVPGRELDRVGQAIQESLDGVRDAPESMTGGRAPEGAVAIKAEAGHPPVHAFPLHDPNTSAWIGALGLQPDPTHVRELSDHELEVLRILRQLLSPGALDLPSAESSPQGGDPRGDFTFRYDEIVTRSSRMFDVFRKLDRVTGKDVPVLICGPTGTGKELVARALHRNDPGRRSKRFYSQNCAAIAQSVLESELFGHERGAFTDARSRRPGLFEVASGSTLFLDEIGEMSLDMQAKLLRVLQENEVVPLGSSEPVKVSVRLVAATHRDLKAEVDNGTFRADLYYRLKVVQLNLPALSERQEDIPLLVDHFLRRVARERGERPKVLDRRDERVLQTLNGYAWPGNVRELENTIRRLAYLTPGDVITYESLAEERVLHGETGASEPARPVRPLDEVVEEVERAEIENALKATEGNRTQAAALLKINRRSLLRRLNKYGFQGEDD